MSVVVKICGLTNNEDALVAARAGADMLGLNFYPPSPRYIDPQDARDLGNQLRATLDGATPLLVGLFVNESPEHIIDIMEHVGLDYVQLSGDESPGTVAALQGKAIKALRPRDLNEALEQLDQFQPYAPVDDRAPSILLDAYHPMLYGGTGEQASLEVASAVAKRAPRLMLAGGLNPENVAGRVNDVWPWGVDVASGVETPGQRGHKDHARIRHFIQAVRSVEAQLHE